MRNHVLLPTRISVFCLSLVFCIAVGVSANNLSNEPQRSDSSAVKMAKTLGEIVISANRITRNASGYSINLNKSNVTKGKSVGESLKFLPNVTKEQDIYKINGVAVREIYIDGMKIPNVKELDNLQGENVESVQIEYLSGSDKSAENAGGIIRINMKKPKDGGYYGSVKVAGNASSYDLADIAYGTTSLNYRYQKLSVYDNLYYGLLRNTEKWEETRTYDNSDVEYLNSTLKENDKVFMNRLSLKYDFNTSHSLGVAYYIYNFRDLYVSKPKPN